MTQATQTSDAAAARPSSDVVPVRRALLSVSDKAGIVELAHALASSGCELISTGGTARTLTEAGLDVTPIDRVTDFPEMMDGRVKTLHPRVHGALLARRDVAEHMAQAEEHGIRPIDLVCVNLYPFEETVAREGVTEAEAIEQIDIGGPSMIRSAAKNFASVAVLTDPAQYAAVAADLAEHGGTTLATRRSLSNAAYARTGAYDQAIAAYMSGGGDTLAVNAPRVQELRYGENPHQSAAVFKDPSYTGASVVSAEQLHGKALSYNNLNDAAATLEAARSLAALQMTGRPVGAAVVKHTNPCGAAAAGSAFDAVNAAMAGDPLAAYGGILAVTAPVDLSTAQRLCEDGVFLEVLIAPSFEADALDALQSRWKNLRLLAVGDVLRAGDARELRSIPGGFLAQSRDRQHPAASDWTHAAGPKPAADLLAAAAAMETVVRALSSNAVCIGGPDASGAVSLAGAGAGQMDRVASCRIAVEKAGGRAQGGVAASDAFFPFADGPELLIDAGVKLIVHPGGSKRDQDTLDLCEKHGVTCMTTGVRHFRH